METGKILKEIQDRQDFKVLLHSEQQGPWDTRESQISIQKVKNFIKKLLKE